MSETTQPETTQYAFGGDHVACISCPARAAGYEPGRGDDSLDAAEMFDELARSQNPTREGILSNEEAEELWLDTIEQLRQTWGEDDQAVETAEIIAATLGWT